MATGKNLRVNLTFGADTQAAKQQIQQLQQSLSQLAAQPIKTGVGKAYAQELQSAKNSALELKVALQNATNIDTGKLNFNKFNQHLKQSKITLTDYAAQLAKLGPQGAESFMQLTRAISSAQTPLFSLQGQMAKLATTMANTIRWQITAGLTTGVMSAFRSVIQYSEELNESLTNIRIVTGKSAEEMSRFAKEAREAAKGLSATTTEYTNASLIYYQQGLNDTEVKKRTDVTVKLAKVVGENAETVSEWMTAIWNNFDDGSRTMEEYADVLAKLGAATASSADEIAGGLEKFAAVAETVGLSYEYAAAALATITAETRQSEDVVGTALKTIFARIENLKLGETLEDGVDLGQYSEALQKVGVDILDANGNLKDMNSILDNIGLTWQHLEKQEKVALAQSVAGIRQYNQFMALMDNWDVMERNVELAEQATGALQDQYLIYSTGIEGAQARVQNQLEKIKNTLLDEDDLIPLLNVGETLLGVVGDLLKAFGGLPGILTIVSSLMLNAFGPKVASMVDNLIVNTKGLFSTLNGSAQAEKGAMVQEAKNAFANQFVNTNVSTSLAADAQISAFNSELDATTLLEEKSANISAINKQKLELELQTLRVINEEAIQQAKIADDMAMQAESAKAKLQQVGMSENSVTRLEKGYAAEESFMSSDVKLTDKTGAFSMGALNKDLQGIFGSGADFNAVKSSNSYSTYAAEAEKLVDIDKQLAAAQEKVAKGDKAAKKEVTSLTQARSAQTKVVKQAKKDLLQENDAYKKSTKIKNKAIDQIRKQGALRHKSTQQIEKEVKAVEDNTDVMKKSARESQKFTDKTNQSADAAKRFGDSVDDASKKGLTFGEKFTGIAKGVMTAAMSIQMLTSGIKSMASAFEEGFDFSSFISGLASTAMGMVMLIPLLTTVNAKLKEQIASKVAAYITDKLANKESGKTVKSKLAEAAASKIKAGANREEAITGVAAQVAKNWMVGLAVAAIVLALLGAGLAISSSISKKQSEKDEETVEKNQENIENLNDLDDQTKSVRELTDAYRELEASEKDTLEAQKDIAEALPDLIEKYKELESKLGIDFGSSQLQKLLNTYEVTGKLDVTKVEDILDAADETSAQASWDAAQANGTIQARQALDTQKGANDGDVQDGKYVVQMGGSDTRGEERKSSDILKDIMGEDWDGKKLTVKTGSASELVESYQKMVQARNRMAKELTQEELNASDTYRELNREIGELQESAEAAQTSLNEMFASAQTLFTEEKARGIRLEQGIDDYSSYASQRDAIIQQLKTDYPGLTDDEYQQLLQGNPVFKELELIYQITVNEEGNEISSDLTNKVKNIADSLTAEEYTIFLQIDTDFIKSHTEEQIRAEIARIKDEITAAKNKEADQKRIEAQKAAQDLEKEIDRYHYLESALEDLEKDYDELGKLKDRAYGPNKLKYINSEIGSLNNQIEAQNAFNELTNEYLEIDKKRLKEMDVGVKFDEFGNVTNATEIQASYANRLNSMDKDSTDYKALDNEFKLFKDYLSNYENTLKQAEDGLIKLNDLEFDKLEKELEKIDNAVQNSVQLTEQELKGLDFQLSKIEDSAYAAALKIEYLGKSAAANKRTAEANLKGIQDILSNRGIDYEAFVSEGFDMSSLDFENFTEVEMEQMLGYQDELISSTQEMRQNWLDMHAAIDDAYDKMQEDMDSASDKMEHQVGLLENYNNLIDLIGAKNLGLSNEDLAMIDEAMVSSSQEQVKQAKIRLDANQSVLADYERQLKEAELTDDQERIDQWKEKVKTAQQQVMEDQNAVNEALANSIEVAQAARERSVNSALEEFLTLTTGFSNIEDMQNDYDQKKQISELYLKDYEEAYELAKLTRKIEKSATDSSSLRVKQKLAELQERIAKAQADGEKMSRYELENLQRQYDLELAKAAMEDAQYAKRQVRLRQDSEGNWGYVYTADQATIDNAQQKYEDTVYAIMQANDEYMQSTYENMMQAEEQLNSTITNIMSRQDLTAAEQQAMIEEATQHYLQLQEFYTGELGLVLNNNESLYDSERKGQNTNIDLMIDKNEDYIGDIINHFNPELKTALIDGEDSLLSYYQYLKDAIGNPTTKGTLFGDLAQANIDYEKNVDKSFNDAGLEIDEFKKYLNKEVPKITQKVNEITEEFKDIEEEGTRNLTKASSELTNWEKDNKPKLNRMEEAVGKVTSAITLMISEWQNLAKEKDISKKITITKTETYVVSTESQQSGFTGTSIGKVNASNDVLKNGSMYDAKGNIIDNKASEYFNYGTEIISYEDTGINTGSNGKLYSVKMKGKTSPVYLSANQMKFWTDLSEFDQPTEKAKFSVGDYVNYFGPGDTRYYKQKVAKVKSKDGFWIYVLSNGVEASASDLQQASAFKIGESVEPKENNGVGQYTTSYADYTKTGYNSNKGTTYGPGTSNEHYTYEMENGKILDVAYDGNAFWYKIAVALHKTSNRKDWTYEDRWIVGQALQPYDTGGYTGAWGPEGRLAMLHQKEIVLNAHDTENMLATVQIVRSIADRLELNARATQQGLSGYLAAASIKSVGDTIEQNVTIHAEFPNATDHSEIEEAFRNLTNLASQHAFKS